VILYIDGRPPFEAKDEDINLAVDYIEEANGDRMAALRKILTDDSKPIQNFGRPIQNSQFNTQTYSKFQWVAITNAAERLRNERANRGLKQ
jgi:hypothetical protein